MEHRFYLRLISSLYISTFFIRTSFGIILATLPIYLNITEKFISYGIVAAASPLFEMGTVFFIGAVVDRYGRKVVLLSGLLTGAIFLFFLTLTKSLYLIFCINAAHGIAAGAILVASLALLADYAPADHRGREMGAFDAVNLLGWVIGYALGVLFLEFFKTELWVTFVFAGLLAISGFIYSYFNITEPEKLNYVVEKIHFDNILKVLRQRSIILLTMPWFIVFMIIGAIMTFLTVSTSQGILHISPIVLAGGILIGGFGLIGTQIFYGRLSDKYGRLPIMFLGTLGFVGLMVTIGIGYVLSPSSSGEDLKNSIIRFWPLLGICGFMALAFGPSALSSLADETHQKMKGVTMAVYSVVISAGMFVGIPAVAGISDHYGGTGVLLFMIGCAVIMFFLMVARYLDVRQKRKTTIV